MFLDYDCTAPMGMQLNKNLKIYEMKHDCILKTDYLDQLKFFGLYYVIMVFKFLIVSTPADPMDTITKVSLA